MQSELFKMLDKQVRAIRHLFDGLFAEDELAHISVDKIKRAFIEAAAGAVTVSFLTGARTAFKIAGESCEKYNNVIDELMRPETDVTDLFTKHGKQHLLDECYAIINEE